MHKLKKAAERDDKNFIWHQSQKGFLFVIWLRWNSGSKLSSYWSLWAIIQHNKFVLWFSCLHEWWVHFTRFVGALILNTLPFVLRICLIAFSINTEVMIIIIIIFAHPNVSVMLSQQRELKNDRQMPARSGEQVELK